MNYKFNYINLENHHFNSVIIEAESRIEAVKKFRWKYDEAEILSITEIKENKQ